MYCKVNFIDGAIALISHWSALNYAALSLLLIFSARCSVIDDYEKILKYREKIPAKISLVVDFVYWLILQISLMLFVF